MNCQATSVIIASLSVRQQMKAKESGGEQSSMANIKSALKRAQVIRIRAKRNAAYKSMMKTAIRPYENALKTEDIETAKTELSKAIRTIDKIETKGVIHKNTANRKKSRLTKALNRVS